MGVGEDLGRLIKMGYGAGGEDDGDAADDGG